MLPELEANHLLEVISDCARCTSESDLRCVVERLKHMSQIDLRKNGSPESLAMAKTISEHLHPHLCAATIRVLRARVRDNEPASGVLTGREKEILGWIKDGKSRWEISKILNISDNTVKFHLCNAMHKLGAGNKTQAVAMALTTGLIEP